MSDPLKYPNEMLMRCAENCGSLRDKVAKLEAANKVLREALDFISKGCLVPPDGGSPYLQDAIEEAQKALKAADEIERK